MFFSITIPLYNRPDEINELLNTLTQQTYMQFEVLVIEDGSTNNARDIVESYGDKLAIQYFFKENEGQGFARNFGFSKSKGDYFIVFDSDCLIPKNYLEIVKNYLFENPLDAFGGPDASHSTFTPVQKAISYAMTSPLTTGGIRGGKKHIGQFHPRGFNMGISREVWENTGGFKTPNFGEDIEFSLRIHAQGYKIGLIPAAIVYHKRRTDFIKFYKQVHSFGRTRINIYKQFPAELKLVHFFPMMFTLFLVFVGLINAIGSDFAKIFNVFLAFYILLIFIHSWKQNASIKVAILSIFASFIQLTAYGLGFMQDLIKKMVFKQI